MLDPAGRAHAAGRHDNARSLDPVDRFGLVYVTNQVQSGIPERRLPRFIEGLGFFVHIFSMPPKNLGDIHRHRAVQKTHQMGNALLVHEFPEFTLYNVYFPNGKARPERLRYKMRFYEDFLKLLRRKKSLKIVVCGDVNTAHKEIDLARPRENSKVSGFLPDFASC